MPDKPKDDKKKPSPANPRPKGQHFAAGLLFGGLPFRDKDDDEGGGGKKAQLKKSPIEAERERRLINEALEEEKVEDEKLKEEELEEELEKRERHEKDKKHYLQEEVETKDKYSADNISSKAAYTYINGVQPTASAQGVAASSAEMILLTQMIGSYAATLTGEGGKSITAMIDQKPAETWHATQYFSPHAPSWAISLSFNPHSPARHYVLTGGNASQTNRFSYSVQHVENIKGSLFSKQQDNPSNRMSVSHNRFSGFRQQTSQEGPVITNDPKITYKGGR